jgi:hypothetical protein
MYRTYVAPGLLPEFAMVMGPSADSYFAQPTPGDGTLRSEITDHCTSTVKRDDFRTLTVSSECAGEAHLQIGQLYSPLWRLSSFRGSSGQPALSASSEGLLEVTMRPGQEDMRIVFGSGPPERWGVLVSFASLLIGLTSLLIHMFRRRHPLRAE